MKGSTLARKARELGWTVSTRDNGRVIWIRQVHGSGAPEASGYAHHIHVYCDGDGDVLSVTESITERAQRDDYDVAGFALGRIEDGARTIRL